MSTDYKYHKKNIRAPPRYQVIAYYRELDKVLELTTIITKWYAVYAMLNLGTPYNGSSLTAKILIFRPII